MKAHWFYNFPSSHFEFLTSDSELDPSIAKERNLKENTRKD